MKKHILLLLTIFLLGGCLSSAPEAPLVKMAKALEERDAQLFLAQMDNTRFAENLLQSMTQSNEPMRALDSLGKMLGIGGMNTLLNSVVDVKSKNIDDFTHGVGSGELMHQCRQKQKSGCPWVPESLLNAVVREISPQAAIARVTTPVGMTTWLALAKEGEAWKVVGQSAVEAEAILYAKGKQEDKTSAPPSTAPTPPPAQEKEQKDAPAPPPPPSNKDSVVRL